MESVNFKPDDFIKLFWHIAFISVFIMVAKFLMQVAKFKLGMAL